MALHNISGEAAEDEVSKHLKEHKFKIFDRNWKTKWCEIDIVAKKDNVMHFVEVKYRHDSEQGGGFDYITKAKLKKMRLAADSWVQINNWSGEYVLSAAEVSGENFEVNFIQEI